MTTLLFDTLKLSRTLQEKGQFAPEHANALATKEDVKDLKCEIRADINSLEIRLQRLIIGGFGVQLAILGAVITFLHR